MSPRARALAHLKILAAAGGVVAACHDSGYGVVDPLPPPSCFPNPEPVVTARYVGEPAADGSRVVELLIKYQSRPDAKIGEMKVISFSTGNEITIVDPAIGPDTIRVQFTAPKELVNCAFWAHVECPNGGNGLSASLKLEPAEPKVTGR